MDLRLGLDILCQCRLIGKILFLISVVRHYACPASSVPIQSNTTVHFIPILEAFIVLQRHTGCTTLYLSFNTPITLAEPLLQPDPLIPNVYLFFFKAQDQPEAQRRIQELERRVEGGEAERRALQIQVEQHQRTAQQATRRAEQAIQEKQSVQLRLQEQQQRAEKAERTVQEQQEGTRQSAREVQALRGRVQEQQQLTRQATQRAQQSAQEVQVLQRRVQEQQQLTRQATQEREAAQQRIQQQQQQNQSLREHAEEAERQVQQAETRLSQSDRMFQDIFQRLIGQMPQSLPLWTVQREEIELTDEEVGVGGWASVRVANFRGMRVAAKCLHRQIISAHNIRLFTREMNMAAQARHPNLLQFIGATMDDQEPIILTELMPTSLRRILEEGAEPPREQITSIACDVSKALNYLHLSKPDPIVHRDVSSANVLLEPCGPDRWGAKLSDYGSVNFVRSTATAGPGNPLYAAPEANDPHRQSPKMDVYSFGILLVEMCSRELPANHEELIRQIQWPQMVTVIRQCIRRDPQARPNMADIVAELSRLTV